MRHDDFYCSFFFGCSGRRSSQAFPFPRLTSLLFRMLKSSLANLPPRRAFRGRALQPCALHPTSLECCSELVLVSMLLTSHDVVDHTAVGVEACPLTSELSSNKHGSSSRPVRVFLQESSYVSCRLFWGNPSWFSTAVAECPGRCGTLPWRCRVSIV